MDGAALSLDLFAILLLLIMLARSHLHSQEVHHRLDDTIEGMAGFFQEMLQRTQNLMEKAAPAIELHNHNPLEQLFRFVQGMKTGNFGAEMNNNPRDDAGRYATTQQEIEAETSPEIIDITN